MAKEGGANKYDANTEAFQMRAQWKKMDMCRKQWYERWSWLLDERKRAAAEADQIKRQAAAATAQTSVDKMETSKSLKPVPVTSTGFIGWLATKPDCKLEIYTSWLDKPPIRIPDAWQNENYLQEKN